MKQRLILQRFVPYTAVCAGSIVCLTVPCGLVAQPRPPVSPIAETSAPIDSVRDTAHTALQARLATITTDTGAFAPGDRDFTRYDTPDLCRVAARRIRAVLRRSLEAQASLDTLNAVPVQDTQPAGVAVMARRCGARFEAVGTRSQDLPDLFRLALLEQDDTLALAVLARQVALAPTAAAQNQIRVEALGLLLGLEDLFAGTLDHDLGKDGAEPARLATAKTVVAQLGSRGRAALVAQLQAHTQFLEFWERNHEPDSVRQEADHIIAFARTATVTELRTPAGNESVHAAFAALLAQAFFLHPDSLPIMAHRVQLILGQGPMFSAWGGNVRLDPAAPLDSVYAKLLPWPLVAVRRHTLTPRLQADFWFPATRDDTIQPKHGVVSILIRDNGTDPNMVLTPHDCFLCTSPLTDVIQRWLARYGATKVAITVVVAVRDRGDPLETWTPAEKANAIRRYVQDYLKLPVTVAVQVAHVQVLPHPDGRLIPQDTTQMERLTRDGCWGAQECVVLTGRDGTLRFVGDVQDPVFAPLLAAALSSAAAPAASSFLSPPSTR